MAEIFPNAPLVEVIFEVRFPGELSVDSLKHQFVQGIRNEFPKLQLAVLLPGAHPLLTPHQISTLDDSELIQFSIVQASYHSKRYPGFDGFRARALKLHQSFCKTFGITKVERTGLRYINHIPLIREKGIVPLERVLNFGYKLPSAVPTKLENFQTSFETLVSEGKFKVRIGTSKNSEGQEFLLLDFDYIRDGELKITDLANVLDRSHTETKNFFESFIAADYLKVMRQK